MNIAWTQAVFYKPPVVLGRQLKTLSPLHVLMLDALDSPVMTGGVCGNDDLIVAVHVCTLDWSTRDKLLADLKSIKAWGKTQRKCDWYDAHADFQLYLRESWTIPQKWDTGAKSEVRANGAYHMAVFGMRNLGMSEQAAWDCPVARLVCYREAYAEQETGKSDLVGDDVESARAAKDVTNGG